MIAPIRPNPQMMKWFFMKCTLLLARRKPMASRSSPSISDWMKTEKE